MLESPLIESRIQQDRWKTLVISGLVHVGVIFLLILIPLIYYQALPQWKTKPELVTYMAEPPPPTVPPPTPTRSQKRNSSPQTVRLPQLATPPAIPDHLPPPPDEVDLPLSSSVSAVGNPSFGSPQPGSSLSGVPEGVIFPGTDLPPPPAPMEKKEPIRVSSPLAASKLIHRVDPVYPPLAIQTRVEGIVLLQVVINEEGLVGDVKVIRGHPLLRESAVEAVRKWKYTPTVLNGIAVPVRATITVNFRLD